MAREERTNAAKITENLMQLASAVTRYLGAINGELFTVYSTVATRQEFPETSGIHIMHMCADRKYLSV